MIIILLFLFSGIFAVPAQYPVYKTDNPPVIDGDLSDWDNTYFVDSIQSDDNIICRDGNVWNRNDFQMGLYTAWDDSMIY